MGWMLRLVETGTDSRARSVDVLEISRPNDLGDIANLGLTLPEAKQLLARVQQAVVAAQAHQHDLNSQSNWLVNYANRYRAGLRVGTSVTEGTANFLVNRRMNKSQQMRWSRRGADLLLQVRCAVYNGVLGPGLGHLFEPVSSPDPQLAKAA